MPNKAITFLTSTNKDIGALATKYADIQTIQFLPDNIKAHDKEAIKELIRRFGFVDPIGVNKNTRHATDGNGRLECLLEMLSDGEKCPRGIIERIGPKKDNQKLPVARKWYVPIVDGLEFSPQDEITLAIAMNKSQESGGIDVTKALDVLKRLKETDPEAFVRTGYIESELDHIRALSRLNDQVQQHQGGQNGSGNGVSADTDGTEVETGFAEKLNETWKVEPYDVWQIGRHKLICADSTLAAEISKHAPGTSRLIFTSPPYDHQRTYESEMTDWTLMMNGVMVTIQRMMGETCDVIINLGQVHSDNRVKFYWNDWLVFCEERLKLPCYGLYVWDKLIGYPGEYHGRLARAHEYFFHFSHGYKHANKWIPTTGESIKRGVAGWSARKVDGSLKGITSPDRVGQSYKIPDSVIRMFSEKTRGIHTKGHPAIFPVALAEFFLLTYTQAGDLCYEPFAGSGSTIIACENMDRVCYASEISPNYCAVILERFKSLFPDQEIKKL